jgi:hypothetical protein
VGDGREHCKSFKLPPRGRVPSSPERSTLPLCELDPPPKIAVALDWAERASLPVADLGDGATVRLALAACRGP